MSSDLPSVEALTTGVLRLAPDLALAYANPAAGDLLGTGLRLGLPLTITLPDATGLHAAIDDARREAQGLTARELLVPRPGAKPIMLDATLTPLDDGSLLLEVVALDRHRQIVREEALAAQHESLREVVRGLAHEIKNPLGGLRGAAQLLGKSVTDPAAAECARIILLEADRLRALVDALLGPAQHAARGPVNLHEVAEQVLGVVTHDVVGGAGGIELVRDYDPSLPDAVAVRDHLVQALLNLLRNAQQALAADARTRGRATQGRITLRTRALRQYTLNNLRHRLVARIEVEDDGPGVPDALRDRLFYPLVSGREGGTGLGLSIAQDLVHRHGGLIEWESAPGRTVFSLLLPLKEG